MRCWNLWSKYTSRSLFMKPNIPYKKKRKECAATLPNIRWLNGISSFLANPKCDGKTRDFLFVTCISQSHWKRSRLVFDSVICPSIESSYILNGEERARLSQIYSYILSFIPNTCCYFKLFCLWTPFYFFGGIYTMLEDANRIDTQHE